MSDDREILAERIRLGIDPEPVCPYVGSHGPKARCPNCADWPRFDPTRREDKTARLALSYGTGRPPIAPGVLRDDPEARVHVSRGVLRIVARWAGAIALVGGAVAIMYAEGQRQPAPGVGFGIALALLMGAALLLGRSNDA